MIGLAAFSLVATLSTGVPAPASQVPASTPVAVEAETASVMVFNDSPSDVTIEYEGQDRRPVSLRVARDGRAMLSVPRAPVVLSVRAGKAVSKVSGDFRTESVLVIASSGNVGWVPVTGG